MQESIYNLIPEVEKPSTKAPMYKSRYPSNTPPTASTFGRGQATTVKTTNLGGDYALETVNHKYIKSGATFGRPTEHYPDPTNYKTKNTKAALPPPKKFQYKSRRKGKTCKADEKPVMGLRSNTNFIKENALSAIMMEPKVKSVPEPRYRNKEDYGKVPEYLNDVKKEIAMEKQYIQDVLAQEQQMFQMQQNEMQLMDEVERSQLVHRLKIKWEEVNAKYQNMTHLVSLDTIGKKRRKEEFEALLSRLEKAIEKMDKPFVFVQEEPQYY